MEWRIEEMHRQQRPISDLRSLVEQTIFMVGEIGLEKEQNDRLDRFGSSTCSQLTDK